MEPLRRVAEFLLDEVQAHRNVLFIAYPGFGKSRSIPYMCDLALSKLNVEKVIVLTRSHAEILQIVQYFRSCMPSLVPLLGCVLGRERVCPFRARTSLECALFRSDGVCQLTRVRRESAKMLLGDLADLSLLARKLGVCPYDLLIAKSKQSRIVLASYLYLSNMELAKTILNLVDSSSVLLIVDEAHGLLAGLESVSKFPVGIIVKALSRSGLGSLVSRLEEGEEVILHSSRIDVDKLRSGVEHNRELVRTVDVLVNLACSDLVAFRRLGSEVEVRSYALTPVMRLLESVKGAIFLTASVPPSLARLSPVTREFRIVLPASQPSLFKNLVVYIVWDVEFTLRFRRSKTAMNIIGNIVSSVIRKLPLVGGVAVVFSSKNFLNMCTGLIRRAVPRDPVYIASDRSEYEHVLAEFKSRAREERVVLLTYAGSPLMEGVNFLLDELICLIMIGFPYPEFSAWNEAKRSFLSRYTDRAFALTYLLPAISTSIQCVGRVTRDLERRVKYAVLADSRFRRFLGYFPEWIRDRAVLVRLSELDKSFGEVFPVC